MSNNKGDLKITRTLTLGNLTTTQRDALTPSNGMVIFNTTTNQEEVYNGSWVSSTGVLSVFGRSGAVTAQSGDYNNDQIDGIQTTLSVVSDRIDWSGDNKNVEVVITSDATLAVITDPQEGQWYTLIVTSSSNAQLIFEGDDFYFWNTGTFPVLVNGKSLLKFYYDGAQMIGEPPLTSYSSLNPITALAPNSWYNTTATGAYTGTPSAVTGVNDLGSNNLDGTTAGVGNMLLTSSAMNSIAGYFINGQYFDLGLAAVSNFMSAGNATITLVVEPNTSDNVNRVMWMWETIFDTWYFSYNASTGLVEHFLFDGTSSSLTGTATITADPIVLTVVKKAGGTDSKLYANNVEIGTLNQPETPDGTAVNCRLAGNSIGGVGVITGYLGEAIFFTSALSDPNRDSIEEWLINKYGI